MHRLLMLIFHPQLMLMLMKKRMKKWQITRVVVINILGIVTFCLTMMCANYDVVKLVLGMSISIVASKLAFSTGGRVIDESIISLTHVTAQAPSNM